VLEQLRLGPEDHVVFTSLDAEMGRAVLELIVGRDVGALPALHLRLMYDADTRTNSALDYEGLVERLAATGLMDRRIFLYCETTTHARDVRGHLGVRAAIAPYPAE